LENLFLLNAGGVITQTVNHVESSDHGGFITTFFLIGLILLFAKLSSLIERLGQPAVLGELLVGIILGNLHYLGIDFFEHAKNSDLVKAFAEFGVILLLFQIGLESNIKQMMSVGKPALSVAVIGVLVPFAAGIFLGPWILPGLEMNSYVFLGATLTATSVGLTARVFKDLKVNVFEDKNAQIVLGAAVIDDVLGLIILAVVSSIVILGDVSLMQIFLITIKSVAFLVGSIFLGKLLAPWVGLGFSKIHSGIGMKFTLAIFFCIVFAYFANLIGLAAIVGAFAAGLILDHVVFKHFSPPHAVHEIKELVLNTGGYANGSIDRIKEKHVEELIEPLGHFFIPVFFVVTGMQVDLPTILNLEILFTALGFTLIAVIGKVVAGFFASKGANPWIIGWGMVPRGEVGLIFASAGKALGVVDDKSYSIVVFMIIVTTLITPPILSFLLKRKG
jgi:Kef-type K+ transport system membrane component KefB